MSWRVATGGLWVCVAWQPSSSVFSPPSGFLDPLWILLPTWVLGLFYGLAFPFGVYILLDGILAVASAIQGRTIIRDWGWSLVEGIIGILIGAALFLPANDFGLLLVLLIPLWAILRGTIEIIQALQLRRLIPNEWLLLLCGILSVSFGGLLLLFPFVGGPVLGWSISIYGVIFGVLLLALSRRLRGLQRTPSSGTAVPV